MTLTDMQTLDSVRHSTVLQKYSLLPLPDHIYNWIEAILSRPFARDKIWQ